MNASLPLDAGDIYSPQSLEDRRARTELNCQELNSRPAAVLVGLTLREAGVSLVLTRRSARLNAHRGEIALPGGKIDLTDKTPVITALRETREEIGIPEGQVTVIGKLPQYETGTGFTISPITAILKPPYEFTRQTSEVDEIFEVPMRHVLHLENYQKRSVLLEGGRRSFWVLPFKNYYIWGATAAILIDLAGRISKAQPISA